MQFSMALTELQLTNFKSLEWNKRRYFGKWKAYKHPYIHTNIYVFIGFLAHNLIYACTNVSIL